MFSIVNMPSQQGKIAIITGANIGLGFETAKGLVAKGAHVIIASRNLAKAQGAVNAIVAELPSASLEIIQLDLADRSSIENFAQTFNSKYDQLDILVNNAGIMIPPYQETNYGVESQWGVNYLGHFLLTGLLWPTLSKTENARIVPLGSLAHKSGTINWENINQKNDYKAMKLYQQSKLACIMFGYELQRRIAAAGKSQKSISAHPGFSQSNILAGSSIFLKILASLFSFMMQKTEDGAKPILMAAMDPSLNGGEYVGPTGKGERKGEPGLAYSIDLANDEEACEKLWALSEQQLGFQFKVQ